MAGHSKVLTAHLMLWQAFSLYSYCCACFLILGASFDEWTRKKKFFEFVDAGDSRQAKARRESIRYFARPRSSGVRGLPAHAAKLGALHPELLRLPVFQRLHCGHEQRRQGAQARHLRHAPASVTSGLISSLRFFTPLRLTKNRKFGNLIFWLPNSPRAVPDSACPANSGDTIGRLHLKRPRSTPGNVLDFRPNRRGWREG